MKEKNAKEGSIEYDVIRALEFLNFGYKNIYDIYNNSYDTIYPWTNESLSTYYDLNDLKDKNVLTVTSSGDHALHAVLAGATNIDSFDKNKLCKYYSALKIAIIKTLNYDEFIKFYSNNRTIKKLNLESIFYHLNDTEKKFWEKFFYLSKHKKIDKLFKDDGYIKPCKNDIKYLEEEFYYKLKNKINDANITYYDSDIKIFNNENKKYDAIFLSNISDFCSGIEKKNIFKKCVDMLNDEGIIYDYHKLKLFYKLNINELECKDKILTKKIPKTSKYESVTIYKKR